MNNSLLTQHPFPPFDTVKLEEMAPAINTLIEQYHQVVKEVLATKPYRWDTLVEPLTNINDQLSQVWSVISHLHSVKNSEELRAIYKQCLSAITALTSELGQHQELYQAYQEVATAPSLSVPQQSSLGYALIDFKRQGVGLPAPERERFKVLVETLTLKSSSFEDHVLDATDSWHYDVKDVQELAGIPASTIEAALHKAEAAKVEGWRLGIDAPTYLAVSKFATNRGLRERFYKGYVTRASDQGDPLLDNGPVLVEILKLREQKAKTLGYKNYAEYSLDVKMAKSPSVVESFLSDLAKKAKPLALKELETLKEFARSQGHEGDLAPWDVSFYSEQLQERDYAINQEALRPYFEATKVLKGLFSIVEKLYGVTLKQVQGINLWDKEASLYSISEGDTLLGHVYVDLYARPQKRGGAWMDECRSRRKTSDGLQLPIAYLVCNFEAPVQNKPALLTHDDVVTIFHEFGHCSQLLLTQIDIPSISGINNVAWDAVECPSQFLEHWCWNKESLKILSSHVETHEPLPEDVIDQLIRSKNFHAGLFLMRQLEFALFDIRLHQQPAPDTIEDVRAILADVRQETAVLMPPSFNRFENSFTHIFAGGYAAGYYSYLWAEVMASDAFSKFEDQGIFSREAGMKFRNTILGLGGLYPAMKTFEMFCGREPSPEAFLRHHGLSS